MIIALKLPLLFSLLGLVLAQAAKDVHDDSSGLDPVAALRQLAEQATTDCYEDEAKTLKIEIEPEGFEGLLTAQTPPHRNTKCIRHCIMRNNQLLNEAHHLDELAMRDFLATAYLHNNNESGAITEELLKRIITTCKSQTSSEADSCERSHLVSTCIMGQLNESRS